jgi:hypothetical protein
MINSNFYITESEKKKILENHIQATKKLYLKEEVVEDETIEKIEIEKPEFYTKLRDLFMPYYQRYKESGEKISSQERIEKIKHTIDELKNYISILENEISNEEDRIAEYGE